MIRRAGNPSALFFQVNGDIYGPAAATGVIKDVELSVQNLTQQFSFVAHDSYSQRLKTALEQLEARLLQE
ncbi:MAG: hypothetical protein AAF701_05270 [Pseudomonadota bacterium]